MPHMPSLEIRPVSLEDKRAWRDLYKGYATFYKRDMTAEIADNVWHWINDPDHELECLIALHDGVVVGLAHYRRMPSPLRGADVGFLDDLFVSPETRGLKIGEALLAELKTIAQNRGWEVMRWLTADDNYRARGLYDKHANKAGWNVYEMKS